MATTLPWTIADLELFPDDGNRYEIIDGELHVSTQPDWHHQFVTGSIGAALNDWSSVPSLGIAIPAPGIIFAQDNAVAPDVVWVSAGRYEVVLGGDGKLHAAPDLAVEVLSPGSKNEQRDREAKLRLYSRQGVREYWIVDWRQREIQVYRRDQAVLQLVVTLHTPDLVTSPLLPGFAASVEQLLGTMPV